MTTFIPQLYQHTPSVGVLDNRGLAVRDIAYNHAAVADPIVELISRSEFSPAGYLTSSIDPRLFTARQTDASVTPNFRYQHDLAGSALRTDSVDAGWQVTLVDAEGRPVWHSDARGTLRRYEYEAIALPGRPLALYEQPAGEAEQLAEHFVYAGNAAADKQFNLAGQVLHHYDTAGVTRLTSQALSGAALSQERQLLANPELPPNWSGSDENVWKKALSATIFITQSTADSTGAPLTQTDAKGNQQRFAYNRAGQRVASWLTLKGKTEQPVIKALSYSAAGQKLREEHGNGCATDYTYEPQTQRLLGCKTSRASGVLQDLRYDYDPVGNILSIYNDAEATRFYRNQKIDPENTYAYDALYQLISATGYESSANQPQAAQNSNWQTPIPTDRTQYVNYTRSYRYDNASNLLQLSHTGAASYTHNISLSDRANHGVFNPQNTALTRQQIEARYDAAGNQLDLNNGTLLSWNPRNLLAQATVVTRDSQTFDGETYLYDGGSMRVQKCTRSQAGTVAHLHTVTYLPGLELHSKTQNGVEKEGWQVVTAGAAGHAQVRALCWTVGKPAGLTDGQLRFSIDNLIGSSLLELDADGQIISQEAYFIL
ncbi:RHS repeat protein [Ewingella americana]|uniref:RHS repeat protein n=1 Tax=Ewingella americana TaxID=41202 RepID=A0A502GHD0_9GAMM|nr:RHS repeat protein [Ewingella americana]TPG61559.1 RHS repeat protein [Ewingella americana]